MNTDNRLDGPCDCPCHGQVSMMHFMPCCGYTYEPRKLAEAKAEIFHATQNMLRVGVVGYCPPSKFDEDEARSTLIAAYQQIQRDHPDQAIAIVSGLTNVGVLKLVYEEAAKLEWYTVGVACERALEHPLYPVDTKIIVGENWGDESLVFVGVLDAMIRIGGGEQSLEETKYVRERGKYTFEYNLPTLE